MINGFPANKLINAQLAQIHIVIVIGILELVVYTLTIKLASEPNPNCNVPSIDDAVPVFDENGANVSADEFGRIIPTVARKSISTITWT